MRALETQVDQRPPGRLFPAACVVDADRRLQPPFISAFPAKILLSVIAYPVGKDKMRKTDSYQHSRRCIKFLFLRFHFERILSNLIESALHAGLQIRSTATDMAHVTLGRRSPGALARLPISHAEAPTPLSLDYVSRGHVYSKQTQKNVSLQTKGQGHWSFKKMLPAH